MNFPAKHVSWTDNKVSSAPLPSSENLSYFKTQLAFLIRCKLGPTEMDMKENDIMMALIGEGMSNS